jgi:hypothetical protein
MFFCGQTGEGLKPMGVMGGAFLGGPVLHRAGHHFGHFQGQFLFAELNGFDFLVNTLREPFPHCFVVEAEASVDVFHGGRWCNRWISFLFFSGSYFRGSPAEPFPMFSKYHAIREGAADPDRHHRSGTKSHRIVENKAGIPTKR